jgi:vacuolar protein sorting-associated protein 26
MAPFFFSTPVDIDIVLEDTDDRQAVDVKLDKDRREKAPLYMDGESIKGAVTVRPKDGKRLEHTGIKVQFIGSIGTTSSGNLALLFIQKFHWRTRSLIALV